MEDQETHYINVGMKFNEEETKKNVKKVSNTMEKLLDNVKEKTKQTFDDPLLQQLQKLVDAVGGANFTSTATGVFSNLLTNSLSTAVGLTVGRQLNKFFEKFSGTKVGQLRETAIELAEKDVNSIRANLPQIDTLTALHLTQLAKILKTSSEDIGRVYAAFSVLRGYDAKDPKTLKYFTEDLSEISRLTGKDQAKKAAEYGITPYKSVKGLRYGLSSPKLFDNDALEALARVLSARRKTAKDLKGAEFDKISKLLQKERETRNLELIEQLRGEKLVDRTKKLGTGGLNLWDRYQYAHYRDKKAENEAALEYIVESFYKLMKKPPNIEPTVSALEQLSRFLVNLEKNTFNTVFLSTKIQKLTDSIILLIKRLESRSGWENISEDRVGGVEEDLE